MAQGRTAYTIKKRRQKRYAKAADPALLASALADEKGRTTAVERAYKEVGGLVNGSDDPSGVRKRHLQAAYDNIRPKLEAGMPERVDDALVQDRLHIALNQDVRADIRLNANGSLLHMLGMHEHEAPKHVEVNVNDNRARPIVPIYSENAKCITFDDAEEADFEEVAE